VTVEKCPALAGFLYDSLSLRQPICGSGEVLALFSLARKSGFPATETVVGGDPVRMSELLRGKSEHLMLAGPFGRQIGEADNPHAVREPSFDGSLDEVGREEGKRDRHVHLADATAISCCDGLRIRRRIRDKFIEPTSPSRDRCNQERAVLGPDCASVLRRHGCGHQNLTASSEWRFMPRDPQHIASARSLGADAFSVSQLDHQLI
jgi:hypothetical protein